MKKDTYIENIEKCIKRQIRHLGLEDEIEIQLFIGEVKDLCDDLYEKSSRKWLKSQKTRRG